MESGAYLPPRNSSVADNSSNNGTSVQDLSQLTSILVIDICLVIFSFLNLVINFSLMLLSIGFIRGGCQSSSDVNIRRPHYGLHFFIFHCVLSSVLLESVGFVTNIGFLTTGTHVVYDGLQPDVKAVVKKTLDFLTYTFFNVTHLNFVLLLNVDKLLYILKPLHYYELMNRKRVCIICLVTWLVASAMASPSVTLVDATAQIRQEAILFAMCVVCPAGFDLLSAIIVSTLVYRIQLRDSHTRFSIKPPAAGSRRRLFSRSCTESSTEGRQKPMVQIPPTSARYQNFCRHCRVFLRAFTPIIWTCITTVPYTATMIYLYFGTNSDEEFFSSWFDPNMFTLLRAFGCLYVTYFTGVPLIIVFNNQAYKTRIKILARLFSAKLRGFKLRAFTRRKHGSHGSIMGGEQSTNGNVTNTTTLTHSGPESTSAPLIGIKEGRICANFLCTEV